MTVSKAMKMFDDEARSHESAGDLDAAAGASAAFWTACVLYSHGRMEREFERKFGYDAYEAEMHSTREWVARTKLHDVLFDARAAGRKKLAAESIQWVPVWPVKAA